MACQDSEAPKDHFVPFNETGLEWEHGLGQIVSGTLRNVCSGQSPLTNTSVPGRAVLGAGAMANQASGFPLPEGAHGLASAPAGPS